MTLHLNIALGAWCWCLTFHLLLGRFKKTCSTCSFDFLVVDRNLFCFSMFLFTAAFEIGCSLWWLVGFCKNWNKCCAAFSWFSAVAMLQSLFAQFSTWLPSLSSLSCFKMEYVLASSSLLTRHFEASDVHGALKMLNCLLLVCRSWISFSFCVLSPFASLITQSNNLSRAHFNSGLILLFCLPF